MRKISDFGYRVILIDLTYHNLPRNTFAVINQFQSIHAVGGCDERTTPYRCGRFIGFSYLYRCVARRARQGDSLRYCPRRIICGRRKRQSYGGVSPRRRNGYIFIRRLSSPVAVRGSGVQIISTRITRRFNRIAKPTACRNPTARRNGERSAPGVFYFNGVSCGNFTRNQTAAIVKRTYADGGCSVTTYSNRGTPLAVGLTRLAAHIFNLSTTIQRRYRNRGGRVCRNCTRKIKNVGICAACVVKRAPVSGNFRRDGQSTVFFIYDFVEYERDSNFIAVDISTARHRRNAEKFRSYGIIRQGVTRQTVYPPNVMVFPRCAEIGVTSIVDTRSDVIFVVY